MAEASDLDPDAAQRVIEYCYEQDWSDGLPLAPASQPLVDRFLGRTSRAPDEVIGRLTHLNGECTVELAAINAAMAGCRPEYFPVVLAAFEALMRERAAEGGGWQSTSGPSPLIVVNGPIRAGLGFNSRGGVFGPGFRANATVARAVGLIVRNAFGVRPHVFEQATQGLPGRWSVCVAENEEESPWEPLCVDGGQPSGSSAVSATLTRTCEFVDNRHTHDAEQVLWDFADTISRTGALIFRDTSCAVVLSPEHAQLLAGAGYAKADVQAWFMEHCGCTFTALERAGKAAQHKKATGTDAGEPSDVDADDFSPILPSPRHVPIVVAGAKNAAISMVVRVFGEWSGTAIPVEEVSSDRAAARAAGTAAGSADWGVAT
ncbi:MAG: hypothetical protein ACRDN9_00435 [Streptosporangiaceae bacterium]